MVRVRGVAHATRKFTETLEHLGWELHPGHPTSDGIAFRYVKGDVLFDALAPDGLGQRADLTTFGSARTGEIPGAATTASRLGSHAGHPPVDESAGRRMASAGG